MLKAGTAFPDRREDASGGMIVRNLGNRATNDLVWREVKIDAEGECVLSIDCCSPDEREFFLTIDEGEPRRLVVKGGERISTVEEAVRLSPGMHTVRLANASASMPDIDRLTIRRE